MFIILPILRTMKINKSDELKWFYTKREEGDVLLEKL